MKGEHGEKFMIETATIIGANGVMGRNVAAILASFGHADVLCICRNITEEEDKQKLKQQISQLVRATSIEKRIHIFSYEYLEDCIKRSDFVFESVAEDLQIKQQIHEKINLFMKAGTVIGTGTSGLSINELSKKYSIENKKNFMGIHFYNPPYNLTLCELIPNNETTAACKKHVKKYLKEVLFRTVVEVEDTPAFLGNRIGFHFINKAMNMAEEYKDFGGIDYIDSILGPFTGRSMPPLLTSDFVGLDVHKAIVDNIYENGKDREKEDFVFSEFGKILVKENRLGKKTGEGLYRRTINSNGEKFEEVYDLDLEGYRKREIYHFSFISKMIYELRRGNYDKALKVLADNHSNEAQICLTYLLHHIVYGIYVSNDICGSCKAADDVMAMGFNWIPPIALIDAFGGKSQVLNLIRERNAKGRFEMNEIEELFCKIPDHSTYDFRRFLKAVR